MKLSGTIDATEIDPMLAAIRQALVDNETGWAAEFGEKQVAVVPPDATEQGIDAIIKTAIGRTSGLCLLLIAGDGKNPDKEAPGPLCNVELEMQLFVSTRMRAKTARSPMELVSAIARFFHHAKIAVPDGPDWYETLKFLGFTALADTDFTAYAITFERELEL